MDPYQSRGGSGSDLGQQASGFVGSLLTYLRTRTPEHWLVLRARGDRRPPVPLIRPPRRPTPPVRASSDADFHYVPWTTPTSA